MLQIYHPWALKSSTKRWGSFVQFPLQSHGDFNDLHQKQTKTGIQSVEVEIRRALL